jgi:hypothetical protein
MAKWWVGVLKSGGYSVRKTAPSRQGNKFVFGPYSTKREACGVAAHQAGGFAPIRGCKGVKLSDRHGGRMAFLRGARRRR